MRIVVVGGTGVLGCAAADCLVDAGHEVTVVARTARARHQTPCRGVTVVAGDVMRPHDLDRAFDGAEVVVNLTGAMPVGHHLAVSRAWRRHDDVRTTGTRHVVDAARRAGVRRLVQHSNSHLYADGGDEWVTERSPLEITAGTEPLAVAEALAQEFTDERRTAVVLRLGQLLGDDPGSRHELRAAVAGRRVGRGLPWGWAHVLHTDDVGPAVLASLHAPDGVYNVGAEPVRRDELVQGYGDAVHATAVHLRGAPSRWRGAERLEPLSRSLRVCSEHFASQTGWRPQRRHFDVSWFDGVLTALPAAT